MNKLKHQNFHKLSVFRCNLCKYRLDYPIMDVEGLGRICGSCFMKGVYTHARPDLKLEEDMTRISFPCKYQNRGCIFEAPFISVCCHEKRCNLRDRICPLVYEAKCDCIAILDLVKHFKNDHKNRILVFSDYSFTLDNSIVEKCDIFYLLAIGLRHFLLQIQFDVDKQSYFYAFYFFGMDNDPYTFNLLVENDNINLTVKSVNALHESKINSSVDIKHALRVHRLVLQRINNNKVVLAVNYERSNFKEYAKGFECPICFYYMMDEIHTCSTGHSVCQKCVKKLNKCPICKSPFSGRNYSMESLITLFKLPCKNSNFCNKYIDCRTYKSHMVNCFYNTYTCPFAKTTDQCTWTGLYGASITHLQFDHEGLVHCNKNSSLIVPVYTDIKYTCCFIVQDYVIICSHIVNESLILSLDLYLMLSSYDQILCTVKIGEPQGCSLQFSLPYYNHNVMNIERYISHDAVKLQFSFKQIKDSVIDI